MCRFRRITSPEIVSAAKKGINAVLQKAGELKIIIPFEPIITVSVGMPGDHHVRKAFITDECVAIYVFQLVQLMLFQKI